ncbi:biliverdin-producing heme oxygenase [Massilia solisilvae]|uniref:Biliverdin-producing heme oxygenase n=1 Tax=Massilia solisilvae TaxID=1811225 RepID=A0ABT2BEX5_9BURK|nr:biliverdin-producing heme oxygenase [Massilia solisilvae]MCS0607060.1 biliverdin-producing heme oxygenase [Massilia solisilvae]
MNSTNDGAGDADVLAALRLATASRHAALDAGLPLSGEAASLADYASHLMLLRDWLAPLQAWLAGSNAGLPDAHRLARIEADLADPSMENLIPRAQAPNAQQWPRHASDAYRWGVCYVIEGSQLGGAVLYQRLRERLAPHPLGYLRGVPEGPGPRWRAFMLALRAHVRSRAEIAEACAGACDAFDAILTRVQHHQPQNRRPREGGDPC